MTALNAAANSQAFTDAAVDGAPPSWDGHKYVWDNVKSTNSWGALCKDDQNQPIPYTGEIDPNGPILCNMGLSDFADEIRQYLQNHTDDAQCWPSFGYELQTLDDGKKAKCAADSDKDKFLYRSEWNACRLACEQDSGCTYFSWKFGAARNQKKCVIHEECEKVASTDTISYKKTS